MLPIISVFAQAPTQDEGEEAGGGCAGGAADYIERVQRRQQTPSYRRVEIRRLGHATGGIVNAGASIQIAALVFIVVLIGWCMLLIPAHTIARGMAGKR